MASCDAARCEMKAAHETAIGKFIPPFRVWLISSRGIWPATPTSNDLKDWHAWFVEYGKGNHSKIPVNAIKLRDLLQQLRDIAPI